MTAAEAVRLTRELLDTHGLHDWTVALNRAKRAAGTCDYRTRTITLSRFLLGQRGRAENMVTITHEVAHALTKGHGHDHVWARKHRELGGDGARCFEAEIVDDTAPWVATCEHGRTFHRYRAPRPGARFRCACRGYRGAPFVFELNPMSSRARRTN